jgi:hypothetical protein
VIKKVGQRTINNDSWMCREVKKRGVIGAVCEVLELYWCPANNAQELSQQRTCDDDDKTKEAHSYLKFHYCCKLYGSSSGNNNSGVGGCG